MTTFKEANFRSKLDALSESQQSIQTLCHWVVFHRKACKESAHIWAQQTLKAPSERHLLYIYLANDILQNARAKGSKGLEFLQEYGTQLKSVMPAVFASAKSETV